MEEAITIVEIILSLKESTKDKVKEYWGEIGGGREDWERIVRGIDIKEWWLWHRESIRICPIRGGGGGKNRGQIEVSLNKEADSIMHKMKNERDVSDAKKMETTRAILELLNRKEFLGVK